jgi:hypothetical protein
MFVPRAAPEKPGMPLVAYFAIVGGALVGLMFAADTYLAKPSRLSFTSNFEGLPPAYKGEPVRTASVPAPRIAAVPVAETTAQAPAAQAPAQAAVVAQASPAHDTPAHDTKPAKPAKRKVARTRPPREESTGYDNSGRQELAYSWRGPQQPAWREPAQEPSWRDTWASGAFEQRREHRPRRNDWRQNDGFWFR